MKINIDKDGEISQKQVWLIAWCTVAASENTLKPEVATRWADFCLSEFNKKFPKQAEPSND